MTTALRFEGVRHQYGRRAPASLDGLDFFVPAGTICGFVGPNGAGKTTTFSIVAGFLGPTAGKVQILGRDGFDPWDLKGRLGVLPQDAELGDRHTPRELVTHLARLQGLGAKDAAAAATAALDRVDLTERRDKRIGTLSHGMRRRVAVATAIVGDPELVLLDEPTAGLDPVQARGLRAQLQQRPAGQTVVISSHNLDELEKLCDWVVMIERGRCLRQGRIDDVTGRARTAAYTLGPGDVPLDPIRAALPGHDLELAGATLAHAAEDEAALDAGAVVITRALAEAGIAIREIRRGQSLEQRFFADAVSGSATRPTPAR